MDRRHRRRFSTRIVPEEITVFRRFFPLSRPVDGVDYSPKIRFK